METKQNVYILEKEKLYRKDKILVVRITIHDAPWVLCLFGFIFLNFFYVTCFYFTFEYIYYVLQCNVNFLFIFS